MTLRGLKEERLERGAFMEQYGSAVLVVGPGASGPKDQILTQVLAPLPPTDKFRSEELRAEGSRGDAEVIPLVKSDRNPFEGMITVGRAGNNDVVLEHASISKMHAIFHHGGGDEWRLEDRNSTNGTFMDDTPLPGGERRRIPDGATLRFGGELEAQFLLPESLWDRLKVMI